MKHFAYLEKLQICASSLVQFVKKNSLLADDGEDSDLFD